ncbi:hypothetical protein AGMMS50268_24990 [Spirochaetia bacterium]|nr:hypothetical protein AGMMS50268_24990 [Spirochaetia bacterium]
MSSGTKNSVGDFLRFIFSILVNKEDEIFKALFANPEETGAIETIFNSLEATRNEWCNNSNVYNQTGEMLEKTLSYFSVLERLFEEDDESYKNRNALLFYRNGDTLWGDKWDILGIFKAYFNTDQVFIVNDTNSKDENLFLDGDFEEKNTWEMIGCHYSGEARFSEGTGILFNTANAVCRQSVDVDPNSTYFVHFFLKGNIWVQIRDNRGLYWKADQGEFGEWVSSPAFSSFSSEEWDARRLFILTDGSVNGITVSFVSLDDSIAYLDYTRLFKKGNWSSFTLIASFSGLYTKDTLTMAPGKDDPVRRRDYSMYGHFSAGRNDGSDPVNPDNLSFVEKAALNDDVIQSPHMAGEEGAAPDAGIEAANDMYIESGDTPLAPGKGDDDDGMDVNYDVMSYIEQANLFGNDVVRPESVYTELLELVRAGGITPYIEIITKTTEE